MYNRCNIQEWLVTTRTLTPINRKTRGPCRWLSTTAAPSSPNRRRRAPSPRTHASSQLAWGRHTAPCSRSPTTIAPINPKPNSPEYSHLIDNTQSSSATHSRLYCQPPHPHPDPDPDPRPAYWHSPRDYARAIRCRCHLAAGKPHCHFHARSQAVGTARSQTSCFSFWAGSTRLRPEDLFALCPFWVKRCFLLLLVPSGVLPEILNEKRSSCTARGRTALLETA